ncbi:hypothetical protein BD410DRAFT_858017 [Rickenella mellea]|uniref:Polysaccharide lyase 14 domain-containing protein n=1 Tax=Rickenella mellea TaxID=50990 RepID=A0A4Y7PH26_9AGAM|nr:hypothetical protein BD410DRAFT_858017 [Rickenella mellea]
MIASASFLALAFAALMSLPSVVTSSSSHRTRGLKSNLFPTGFVYASGFTTADGVSVPGISHVGLNDSALHVSRVTAGLTHHVVQKNGKNAWEAVYANGSYHPTSSPLGGFGFYVGGSKSFVAATTAGAQEVLFSYSVMFQNGFEWVQGGKLPGGFGGEGDSAFHCSGGRQYDRDKCFDLRLMWRLNGTGEVYAYLPLTEKNNAVMLAVPPMADANPDYGFSVGRGSFKFPAGEWVTVAERIKMNDPSKTNGEVQLWFNGKSVINMKGLQLRNTSITRVQGMHFQTFFGGSTPDWATPKEQMSWFADVSGAVIRAHSN